MAQTDTSHIYALIDPDTDQVRYIGKAVNPTSRLAVHKSSAKNESNATHKYRWLRSLSRDPVLKVLDTGLHEDIDEMEIAWIAYGFDQGWPLTNHALGGGGTVCGPNCQCKKHSPEFHEAHSKKMKEVSIYTDPAFIKKEIERRRTPEARKANSERVKKQWEDPVFRTKMTLARRNRGPLSEKARANIGAGTRRAHEKDPTLATRIGSSVKETRSKKFWSSKKVPAAA